MGEGCCTTQYELQKAKEGRKRWNSEGGGLAGGLGKKGKEVGRQGVGEGREEMASLDCGHSSKVMCFIHLCPPTLKTEPGPGFKEGFGNSLLSE